jgi:hypothetical protein
MAQPPTTRADPLAKPPPQPVGIPEQEAKLLWCPFTPRIYGFDGTTIHEDNCCITGQCMLWHYDPPIPNSSDRTGWCAAGTLAPGEEPTVFEPLTPQPLTPA